MSANTTIHSLEFQVPQTSVLVNESYGSKVYTNGYFEGTEIAIYADDYAIDYYE